MKSCLRTCLHILNTDAPGFIWGFSVLLISSSVMFPSTSTLVNFMSEFISAMVGSKVFSVSAKSSIMRKLPQKAQQATVHHSLMSCVLRSESFNFFLMSAKTSIIIRSLSGFFFPVVLPSLECPLT